MSADGHRFLTEVLLHGGDYNPDQWLEHPDILEKDIQMLKDAGCNEVTLGVFAWSALEPEEGRFTFDWLRERIDQLYANGIRTILATPSGARPRWLAEKYPEVLRVDSLRRRALFGGRHNHCLTSPAYRERVRILDEELSKAFGSHPGVVLWHLSNELGGDCHCPLCQEAFRRWLKERYGTIEELNRRWYTAFWSHTYDSFEQVESPSPIGESDLHGLNLDWKRFVTEQTASFLQVERKALRTHSALPVTTNFMYYFGQLDYARLAKEIDIASWDTYPTWHKGELFRTALDNGMWHDCIRSLLGRPFLQMESCPSSTNWQGVSKLKKPGLLKAQGLQAIAHGADGALYFQIRNSRGSSEKFHGAVIDHYGGEDTRVFGEVREVGEALSKLSEVAGATITSPVCILYDWENLWAMEDAQGPRNNGLHWKELSLSLYHALKRIGVNVDLKNEEADPSPYRLVIVPMLYQFREGFAKKLRSFTEEGGQLLVTFWSGVADGTDLCYLGGTPHGLMDVLGLRSSEIDGLYDWEENHLVAGGNTPKELHGPYRCQYLCDLPKPLEETTEVLLTYGDDFYAGWPALTRHPYGKGTAWYVACHAEERFFDDLIALLVKEAGIKTFCEKPLPEGLLVNERRKGARWYRFYQNFGQAPIRVPLPSGQWEALLGDPDLPLPVYGTLVLKGLNC